MRAETFEVLGLSQVWRLKHAPAAASPIGEPAPSDLATGDEADTGVPAETDASWSLVTNRASVRFLACSPVTELHERLMERVVSAYQNQQPATTPTEAVVIALGPSHPGPYDLAGPTLDALVEQPSARRKLWEAIQRAKLGRTSR